jgi:isoleucyl-tRNA synthetase
MEQEADPRYGVAEEAGVLVALDLQLTDPLKREGLARDLVRNLQVARKDAGLSVSQRIELGLATESREIQEAICEHHEYIMDELLATTLEYRELVPYRAKVDVSLDGSSVLATFRW